MRGWPLPPLPWLYGDRMLQALSAAAQIHATQVRKGLPALAPLVGYLVTATPSRVGALWASGGDLGSPTRGYRPARMR